MMLNKLLSQQVQKHFGGTPGMPEAFAGFLKLVTASYDLYDDKINTLKSAVDQCGGELCQLNYKLSDERTALANAHAELGRIFNQVNEGFFIKDIIADRYIQMSVGCEKIYGYSIGDFYANSLLWYQVIHPDDLVHLDKQNELLNNGTQTKNTYRIIHKDKSTRWIEVKSIPVMTEGRLTRVEGVVIDITERKNAEAEILMNEGQLDLIYNTVTDNIFVLNIEAGIYNSRKRLQMKGQPEYLS